MIDLNSLLMEKASDLAENATVDEMKDNIHSDIYAGEAGNFTHYSNNPDSFPEEVDEIRFTVEAQDIYDRWHDYFYGELKLFVKSIVEGTLKMATSKAMLRTTDSGNKEIDSQSILNCDKKLLKDVELND